MSVRLRVRDAVAGRVRDTDAVCCGVRDGLPERDAVCVDVGTRVVEVEALGAEGVRVRVVPERDGVGDVVPDAVAVVTVSDADAEGPDGDVDGVWERVALGLGVIVPVAVVLKESVWVVLRVALLVTLWLGLRLVLMLREPLWVRVGGRVGVAEGVWVDGVWLLLGDAVPD